MQNLYFRLVFFYPSKVNAVFNSAEFTMKNVTHFLCLWRHGLSGNCKFNLNGHDRSSADVQFD